MNEGVRRLLDTPGWNPYLRGPAGSPTDRAVEALRQARVASAAAQASTCPDCDAARKASGDPTDLCPRHLAAAMGLG